LFGGRGNQAREKAGRPGGGREGVAIFSGKGGAAA
jgi:hypothetical protein